MARPAECHLPVLFLDERRAEDAAAGRRPAGRADAGEPAEALSDLDLEKHIIGDPITVSWESDPNFLGAFKGALPGHYRYNHRMYCHFMQDGLPPQERGIFIAGDDVSWTPAWVEGAVTTGLNAVWGIINHLGGADTRQSRSRRPLRRAGAGRAAGLSGKRVVKLYSGPLSLFSRKVEIALHEKGLPFERVMVPFSQERGYAPKHPDVLAANPSGQVPVLVDGGLTLFDSTVIFEYLEDAYPDPPLYPVDAKARAECGSWTCTPTKFCSPISAA